MTGERQDERRRRSGAAPPRPRIDQDARDRLGRDLRLFYAGILDQPLPDRFARLLDELSARAPGPPVERRTEATATRSREGSR